MNLIELETHYNSLLNLSKDIKIVTDQFKY